MKVSVITVTFNALENLRRTVKSVTGQSEKDFEYIVVDGASSDGSSKYLQSLGDCGIRWISEPDGGIYEAMNKGVRIARGDYCLFMNAGDCFVDSRVLGRISGYLDGTDVVLGNEVRFNGDGKVEGFLSSRGGFTLENLLQSSVCHQASFIRRGLLTDHPYDESLRLVSDWKFILERFLENKYSFKTVNVDICFFLGGGMTDSRWKLGKRERRQVLLDYPEYEKIWGAPYNPSVWNKIRKKILSYLKKIQYSRTVKELL